METKYWVGPYNVIVGDFVPFVPAKDGVNRVAIRNGKLMQITDIKNTIDLTQEQYLDEYCYYDDKIGFYRYNASLKHEHNWHMYVNKHGKVCLGNIYKVIKNNNRNDDCFDDDCCVIL